MSSFRVSNSDSMQGDRICIDGVLRAEDELRFDPDRVLSQGYLYQRIHTFEHRPLHIATHLRLIQKSYRILYGIELALDEETLRQEIALTLRENRYPEVSNLVTLYLFAPREKRPGSRMISCTETFVYPGYTLWHSRLRACTLPYDYPFPEHETALSRIAHTFAQGYALRTGCDLALTENGSGVVTGAGENPLFAVFDNRVLTTSIENGAAESLWRHLGIRLCQEAALEVEESALTEEMLKRCDELFCMTPQGVVSLKEWNGRLGFNIVAEKTGAILDRAVRAKEFEFGIR